MRNEFHCNLRAVYGRLPKAKPATAASTVAHISEVQRSFQLVHEKSPIAWRSIVDVPSIAIL